jgi:hypothetical protein
VRSDLVRRPIYNGGTVKIYVSDNPIGATRCRSVEVWVARSDAIADVVWTLAEHHHNTLKVIGATLRGRNNIAMGLAVRFGLKVLYFEQTHRSDHELERDHEGDHSAPQNVRIDPEYSKEDPKQQQVEKRIDNSLKRPVHLQSKASSNVRNYNRVEVGRGK